MHELDSFFVPKSIAVVGASSNSKKVGNSVLVNLLEVGYPGKIYPINPKATEIAGVKTYSSVLNVEGEIELGVIAIPAQYIKSTLEEFTEKGIKYALIITAGFKETGVEGAKMENELIEYASQNGIRMVGPNCLGLLDMNTPMNASFSNQSALQGNLALISQSGALITGILDWTLNEGIGLSRIASIGNKADVNEIDMLVNFSEDENTHAIMAYLESIDDGPNFIETAKNITQKKPIIIIKSGSSAAGARAASSHTGSMAGSDSAYNAAFRKCGVLRAGSVEELFDAAFTISNQPLVSGKKIAIITNAGGPGIIATDEAERLGLELADLSADTQDELRSFMAAAASWHNPVDVLGTAMEDEYDRATRICIKDESVDMVLVILTPQKQTTPKETADKIIQISREFDKPIAAAYVGAHDLNDSILYMKQNGVPAFPFPERAIRALRRLFDYSIVKERNLRPAKPSLEVDQAKVREILDYVKSKNRVNLLGSEANLIAKAYGIAAPITETAYSVDEAIDYANQIGYPVVMKITSPDIVHKTDFGGVVLNVKSDEEVENHYHTILSKAKEEYPDSGLLAIEVQEMSTPGKELIVGASQDPQFGHLVMIGLGGVYTNYFKDVAFELAPVSDDEAGNMLRSLRTYPILEGVRGENPSDINAIKDTILRISRLVEDFPEILEMDINPFFVFDKGNGISAVDVKITIAPSEE